MSATQKEMELIGANQKLTLENEQFWMKLAESLRYKAEVVKSLNESTVNGVVSRMKKAVNEKQGRFWRRM